MGGVRIGNGQEKHSLLKRIAAATAVAGLAVAYQNAAGLQATSEAQDLSADAPYLNAELSVDERVEDLLSRMNLKEKLLRLQGSGQRKPTCSMKMASSIRRLLRLPILRAWDTLCA